MGEGVVGVGNVYVGLSSRYVNTAERRIAEFR